MTYETRAILRALAIAGALILLVICYYEFLKRGDWEAAARTDISRQATKQAEKAFEEKEKEYLDKLLELKEESRNQAEQFRSELSSYQRLISGLKSEIERVREEGRANEELLARLSGFALFERVLARLDESWAKHGLTTANH